MEYRDKLKIVYAYTVFKSAAYGDVRAMNEKYISDLNKAGFNIEGFCLTLDPPNDALTFRELDRKWKWGDPTLFNMYEDLERKIDGKDVLINASGVNLHPEFVERLPIFTVYQCFDDPESSEHRSKPTAFAYDLSLVGNIAEVDTYKSWGVKNVEWTCLGLMHSIFDQNVTYESILHGKRDINLLMMIDKTAPWRSERLNKIDTAFPTAHFYGRGWKRGILPREKELEMLARTKIGPNIHNSTGPVNLRTFYLPANGVMQICDNKSHLGKLFELDKEVVGFDSIEECIELCRYYLAHEDKRRAIAANGWKRVMTDYTEEKVFARTYRLISDYLRTVTPRKKEQIAVPIYTDRPISSKALSLSYTSAKTIYSSLKRTAMNLNTTIRKTSSVGGKSIITNKALREILNHTDLNYIDNESLLILLSQDVYSLSQVLLGIEYFEKRLSAVLRGGDVLIDVGCGVGNWTIAGSFLYEKCYGYDIDPGRIAVAKQIASMFRPQGEVVFEKIDSVAVPRQSKEADALLCINTFNVIPVAEQVDFLVELRRLAKDDAVLYMTVHNFGYIVWLGYNAIWNRSFLKFKEWIKIICKNALYAMGMRKSPSYFVHRKYLDKLLNKTGWRVRDNGPEGSKSNRLVKPIFKEKFLGMPLINEYIIVTREEQ